MPDLEIVLASRPKTIYQFLKKKFPDENIDDLRAFCDEVYEKLKIKYQIEVEDEETIHKVLSCSSSGYMDMCRVEKFFEAFDEENKK